MTNRKILGLLGLARRAGKVAFGTEMVTGLIEKKKVKLLIIATDASERTKKNFRQLAEEKQIPIREIETIEEISRAIGQTNKAVLGITDTNFSKEMIKSIDGGDIIG